MSKDLRETFSPNQDLDVKSLEFLTRALEQRNLPEFDYLEFRQSVGNLKALDMDDQTAFRSAFATASTMGITRERLLETAQFYKSVLRDEQKKFEAALRARMQQEVNSREAEVAQLKAQVEKQRQQIITLQQQIASGEQSIATANAAVSEEKSRIAERQAEFEHTLSSIVNAIDHDIERIDQFL